MISVFYDPFQIIQSNLPKADTLGTKGKCPLTGDVSLWEIEKIKCNRGHVMHHNKLFKVFN